MLRTLALALGFLTMNFSLSPELAPPLAPEVAPVEIGRIEKAKSAFLIRDRQLSPAKRGDTVLSTDVLTTDTAGGLIILLKDGSTLITGGSSELRVAKHDPATQQTLVEFLHGALRAQVKTVTRSGGVFAIRTPTAYITALGTGVAVETSTASISGTVTQEQVNNTPLKGRDFTSLIQLEPGVAPAPNTHPSIFDFDQTDSTLVGSLDGVVGVSDVFGAQSSSVYLVPNQFTDVNKGAAPIPPAPIFNTNTWQSSDNWNYVLGKHNLKAGVNWQYTRHNSFFAPFDYHRCDTGYSPTGQLLWKWDPNNVAPTGSAPPFNLNINGNNISTGMALNFNVTSNSPCTVEIFLPSGTVFHPKGFLGHAVTGLLLGGGNAELKKYQRLDGFGTLVIVFSVEPPDWGGGAESSTVAVPVRAFCVDLHKLPPHQKTEYRVANAGEQEKFSSDQPIIAQTVRMLHTGEITQGSHSVDEIIQWTIWAHIEHLNEKGFDEQFTGLVHRNIEARKEKWDKDTQRTVHNLARELWQKVDAILRATYK